MRGRMNRSIPVSTRINVEYCDKLEAMAYKERSSLSKLVAKIVCKYIDENWDEEEEEDTEEQP